MKKFRTRQFAVLIVTVMLFTLVVSVSAAADTLWITQNLNPSLTVSPGETVTLTVAATGGDGPISFQWWSRAGALIGSNLPSISFQTATDNELWCVVSSGSQSVSSNHCAITVSGGGGGGVGPYDPTAPVTPPQIVTQPKSITLAPGQSGVLSVQATCAWQSAGVGLEYQWYSNTTNDMRYAAPINGATSASYTVPASYSPSKLYYVCSINSTNGVDKSQPVYTDVVTVYCGELNITKHPTGETVNVGGKATFIARADGAAAHQWRIVRNDGGFYRVDEAPSYINGLQVYGADGDTLVLSNIPASMNGMSVICVFYADAARTQFKITNSAQIIVNNPNPTPSPTPASSYIPGAVNSPAVSKPPVANATILTPTISVQPEGAVLEQGQNTSLSVVAVDDNPGGGTELKYQWYKSDKNSNASGTAIAGAQSASYVPETTSGIKYYYVGVWASDGSKTSKVIYSSPVAVTYSAPASPSPSPTPVPIKGNDKSLLSQLALPLIAMLVAAAVGIGAFIVLKKTNSEDDDYSDRGRGRGKGKRNYDDRYDDYDT